MDDIEKTKEQLLEELLEAREKIETLGIRNEREVREKKEIESRLATYENRFDLLLEAANLAWWEMDVPTGNVIFSDSKTEMLGFSPGNFKHYKDFMALVHPEDYDNTLQAMTNHYQGKAENYDAYYRILTASGSYKSLHDIGRISSRDSNGKPLVVTGIAIDMIDKIRINEAQQESEARYTFMFQEHKSMMLLIDPTSGEIIDANKSASAFYNYSIDELRGMNIDRITIKGSPLAVVFGNIKKSKPHQNSLTTQHRLSTGEIRQVELHSSMIEFNHQKILFSIIEDISERKKTEEKLSQSEQALRKAEEISKFGHWQLHLNEKLMFSSDGAKKIYGLKSNKNMLKEVQEQVLTQYRPMLDQALDSLLHFGTPYEVEFKIKRKSDGKIIDIYSIAEFEIEKNIVFGTIQDISDRMQVEKDLQDLALHNQTLLQTASDGIHVVDKQGRVVEANNAFCKMLGYTSEELMQLNVSDWDRKWPADELYKKINDLMSIPSVFETRHRRKDGSLIDVEINSIGIHLKGDQVLYAAARDITERKRTEEALKRSEIKFRTIIDRSPVPMVMYNEKQIVILLNQAFYQTFGYTLEDVPTLTDWRMRAYPDQKYREKIAAMWDAESEHSMQTGANLNQLEVIVRCKNNSYKTVLVSGTVFSNSLGGNHIISFFDITERKLAELTIQNQNTKLQKLNADKDRFISILAHDLKGPFSSILGFLELIAINIRKYDLGKIENMINTAGNSAKHVYQLLEDILLWIRSESGHLTYDPQKLHLKEIYTEIIEIINPTALAKNLSIHCIDLDNIVIYADIYMLNTVIRNLVSNAVKFTHPGGRIDVSAIQYQSKVTVTVSDNGVGIPPDKMKHLFDITEKYTTRGTLNEEGTGLGLILCKDLIEKQGGEIWVESEPGKGSTFHFTLPVDKRQ